jgi:Fic family protein
LFERDTAVIRAQGGRATGTLLAVHEALRRRPVTTLSALGVAAGISFPTAAKAIDRLTALGVVDELTGGRRNRVFGYRGQLAILNEGMEPL